MRYGEDFHEYYIARNRYYADSQKKSVWIWLGILTNLILVLVGLLILPMAHLFTWSVVIFIGSLLIFSWLIGEWREQRRYSCFERWLKWQKKL